MLGFPGIWFLNGSYQWSCTALAREEDGAPWLARTLDWPFPGLGRFVEIARMRGPAGEFYNVTWPGYVGALTAFAPGRFAAAINQAPLRRRTSDPRLRLYDLAANAIGTLRHVPRHPARPAAAPGVRNGGRLRRSPAHAGVDADRAAGDLHARRMPGRRTLRDRAHRGRLQHPQRRSWRGQRLARVARRNGRAVSAPARCSPAPSKRPRNTAAPGAQGLASWRGSFARDSFAWVAPPVLNPYTRIAVEMCPARGILRAVGYELPAGRELAEPVTLPCELRLEPLAA